MSRALRSMLTIPNSAPVSQTGETLFRAIETNDLQWIQTNRENLSSVLLECQDHNSEGLVTPLQYAAIKGNIEAFKTLFEITGGQELDHFSLLQLFMRYDPGIRENHEQDIETIMKTLKIDPFEKDNLENSLLHIACHENKVEIIIWLIKQVGVRFSEIVKTVNSKSETPIIACSKVGALKCLNMLLSVCYFDSKACLDMRDNNEDTAMHIASRNGYCDIVKILLKEGALVDVKNKEGRTPLREAITNSHTNVIEAILTDRNWEIAMKTGTDPITHETATESLIKNFPKMAERLMDNCCYKDPNGLVFDVKFHEEFHGEVTKKGTQRKQFEMAVNNPVTVMLERNHENLFTHPLTLIHFRHEFRTYGIYHYIQRFCSLLVFSLLFKAFMMKQFNPSDEEACELYREQCQVADGCQWGFCTQDKTNKTLVNDVYQFNVQSRLWLTVLFIFRTVYFFIFYEVVQLVHVRHWYKGGELFEKVAISLVEMVLWIIAIFVVWNKDGPEGLISCQSWQRGVILLPFMWLQLFLLSKNLLFKIPFLGKYVLVFYGVFLKTLMVLVMLLVPTYGFVYAFHGLFKRNPLFSDFYRSSFKTVTMLFGEFELSDLLWPKSSEETTAPFFWVSLSMIYLYMVVMCAVVMNTFISIAVDNIGEYHKNAVLKDQLSALQEYDTPTLVSKLFSSSVEKYLEKKHDWVLHGLVTRFFYYIVPTALFRDENSMLIRMSQQQFLEIIRVQHDCYELKTREKREKVSNLIKNMKTRNMKTRTDTFI